MQKALCKKRCAWKHVSVSAIAQHASSMYIHIYVYKDIYIYIYKCVYLYIYICVHRHIPIEVVQRLSSKQPWTLMFSTVPTILTA